MHRIETRVLLKQGKNQNCNWRQYSLFASVNETRFELREYYGQTLKSLKRTTTKFFDDYGIAVRSLTNILRTRKSDFYEEIEDLKEKLDAAPFSRFSPPKVYCDFNQCFVEQFNKVSNRIAIPIRQGKRVYVQYGLDATSSVRVIDSMGKSVQIRHEIEKALLKSVYCELGDNGILEAYMHSNSLMLVDLIATNGAYLSQNYTARHKTLKNKFKASAYIQVCEISSQLKDRAARYFLLKDNEQPSVNSLKTVIPNFYSINAIVIGKAHTAANIYKVALTTNDGYREIGVISTPTKLDFGVKIQVAFNRISEGCFDDLWFSPYQPGGLVNYCESGAEISQLDDLSNAWKGVT